MKIRHHVHHLGELQRSLVVDSTGTSFRRIHCFFDREDGTLGPALLPACWQEWVLNQFMTVLDDERRLNLERHFIETLIASNGTAPVHGTDEDGNSYKDFPGSNTYILPPRPGNPS